MQVSVSTSSEAMTELYQQSRQLRVLFQRIDQVEVRLCVCLSVCLHVNMHVYTRVLCLMGIKLRLCAFMCTVYMCVVHMGLGMCVLSHTPVVPLPHPALLPTQNFVQAVSHNVGVMEEYMEQSERQLEPSQLRKVLKALPSFLRVWPVSESVLGTLY